MKSNNIFPQPKQARRPHKDILLMEIQPRVYKGCYTVGAWIISHSAGPSFMNNIFRMLVRVIGGFSIARLSC